MTMTINSKVWNRVITFWCSDDGGYIYVDENGQPRENGDHVRRYGKPLSCKAGDRVEFEKICKRWYSSYR